jgi:hypothetical protein
LRPLRHAVVPSGTIGEDLDSEREMCCSQHGLFGRTTGSNEQEIGLQHTPFCEAHVEWSEEQLAKPVVPHVVVKPREESGSNDLVLQARRGRHKQLAIRKLETDPAWRRVARGEKFVERMTTPGIIGDCRHEHNLIGARGKIQVVTAQYRSVPAKTITKSLHSPAFSCGGSGAVAEVVMVKQVEEDWLRLA